ncbi:MAG: beta-ketoacyl synthase chain length factor [Myxococcota bacterium]
MTQAPRVVVRRFEAWAPGAREGEPPLATREDWAAWARAPVPLGHAGQPDVPFLPAGVRRRATRLTRLALRVAFDCSEDADRSAMRTVFASRHGAIHVAVKILASIAREEAVSPLQFSHSVHNAQAGLFSIAAGNRHASSSIAASEDTFGHGFLEALLHLERAPDEPVLLVACDEPLPSNLIHLIDEPETTYGVALLLARDGAGTPLEFGLAPSHAPPKERGWPEALEFVRFLASEAPELALESGRRRFWWRRG